MDPKKFIVISSGKVLPEFTIEQVGENLAKLYKKPSAAMIELLVSGEPRKVKSVSTRAQAQSKCAHLSSLGLRCSFTEIGKEENELPSMYTRASYMDESPAGQVSDVPPPEDFDEPDVGDEPEHSEMFDEAIFDDVLAQAATGRVKKVLLVMVLPLLVIFGLGAGGYFLASTLLNAEVPVEVAQVESAMYELNQPAVFMYANVQHIKRLASLAGHEQLQSDSTQAMLSTQFLRSFANTSYLFEQTDYLSAGLNIETSSNAEAGAWVTVLLGNFDVEAVQQELSDSYDLSAEPNGLYKLVRVSKLVDGLSCPLDEQERKLQTPNYAEISSDKVVFANDPDLLNKFITNLSRASEFERVSDAVQLAQWQTYRQDTLAATQFFTPESVKQSLVANLAVNAVGSNASFDVVGARVKTALLSRGVKVELDGFSGNTRTLENAKIKVERSIRSTIGDAQDSLPSVANLMSRIEVSTGDAITIAVTLDSELLKDINGLVSDFAGGIFGGMGGSSRQEVVQEQVNLKPWDYSINIDLMAAASSSDTSQESYAPLFSNGSASIFMESLGAKAASPFAATKAINDTVQVTLKAKRQMPKIDNAMSFDESGVVQRLMITEVLSAKGDQLVADERCKTSDFGSESNQQANERSSLVGSQLETSKSVRLTSGSKISDIARVKGWYEVAIPTQVEKVTLSIDSTIDAQWEGGGLRLQSVKGSTVSYSIMGEQANLLNVRGLNAAGKVLNTYSSISVGDNVTKTFAGKVATVDVFIASEWDKGYFQFDLSSVTPRKLEKQASLISKDEVAVFSDSNKRNFNRALMLDWMSADERKTIEQKLAWQGFSFDGSKDNEIGRTRSKSVHVFFKHDADRTWSRQLQGLVIVPLEQAILIDPKSFSLTLNIDGKEQAALLPSFSVSSSNGVYLADFESSKKSYIIGSFSLDLDDTQDKISEITGTVDYRLATALATTSVSLSQAENVRAIKLHRISYGAWKTETTYLIDNSVSNIYSAKLFTADGGEHRAKVAVDLQGHTTLVFDSDQKHQKIELYRVKKSFNKTESFALKPAYK